MLYGYLKVTKSYLDQGGHQGPEKKEEAPPKVDKGRIQNGNAEA